MDLETTRSPSHAETALIRAVARKDEDAVKTLYCSHVEGVFRFVYRRVNESYEDAEEITQDTFLTALRLAHGYRGDAPVFTWLCALARVRIVDFYRKSRRGKRVPREMLDEIDDAMRGDSKGTDPFEIVDESLLVDALMSVVSEHERDALLLRYVEGLSLKEVAAQLGRSEKSVDGLLDRAKRKQRALIERWWGRDG